MPGGQLPPAHVKCCQAEWPVFLSSKSLLIRVLPAAAMSQQQLWVFIYSCVRSQSLCRCQKVYGLLKFWSLCFYGHCLLRRSAVWGKDRFAFRLDDGWRLRGSSAVQSSSSLGAHWAAPPAPRLLVPSCVHACSPQGLLCASPGPGVC